MIFKGGLLSTGLPERTCKREKCRKKFFPRRSWQVYCSNYCRIQDCMLRKQEMHLEDPAQQEQLIAELDLLPSVHPLIAKLRSLVARKVRAMADERRRREAVKKRRRK